MRQQRVAGDRSDPHPAAAAIEPLGIVAGGVESISLTMKSINTDNLINPLLKEQVREESPVAPRWAAFQAFRFPVAQPVR